MRTIYLNHIEANTTNMASWVLLSASAMVLLATLSAIQYLRQGNEELQAKIDTRHMHKISQRPIAIVPDASSEAVRTAIQNIVIPWASLLKALEAANQDKVKMLVLEPNAKTRTVKLNLIALDQASMWAYLESLRAQHILQEVRLVSNESVDVNGVPALAFRVEAKWQD